MGKPHKKETLPPRQVPQIHPDALLLPLLLPYAQELRNGKAIPFDEKFAVPVEWDAKELALIHDGIREWLKHGTFDRLASILKDDPFRIAHPVIRSQIRRLAKLSRGLEETDSFPDSYGGPLLPEGTRLAARTALLTIFQGMWSAFSPGTILHVKTRKSPGRRASWQKYELESFLEEYNELEDELEKLDTATDAVEYPLRPRRNEAESAYLKRIADVVQHLDSTTVYSYKGVRKQTGQNTEIGTIVKDPMPRNIAEAIAKQAIPARSLQKHRLLAGMFAHYFGNDHTKWNKLHRIIQRAEGLFRHLDRRKARRG